MADVALRTLGIQLGPFTPLMGRALNLLERQPQIQEIDQATKNKTEQMVQLARQSVMRKQAQTIQSGAGTGTGTGSGGASTTTTTVTITDPDAYQQYMYYYYWQYYYASLQQQQQQQHHDVFHVQTEDNNESDTHTSETSATTIQIEEETKELKETEDEKGEAHDKHQAEVEEVKEASSDELEPIVVSDIPEPSVVHYDTVQQQWIKQYTARIQCLLREQECTQNQWFDSTLSKLNQIEQQLLQTQIV